MPVDVMFACITVIRVMNIIGPCLILKKEEEKKNQREITNKMKRILCRCTRSRARASNDATAHTKQHHTNNCFHLLCVLARDILTQQKFIHIAFGNGSIVFVQINNARAMSNSNHTDLPV